MDRDHRRVALRAILAVFLFNTCWTVAETASAQSEEKRLDQTTRNLNPNSNSGITADLETKDPGLRQVVKVVFNSRTNTITLIGTKEDIAIVKCVVMAINEELNLKTDRVVTEKVILKFQMAESVSTMLSSALSPGESSNPVLQVSPVHFPEAILLFGPASAVKRAKELIATIDSHVGFPKSGDRSQKITPGATIVH